MQKKCQLCKLVLPFFIDKHIIDHYVLLYTVHHIIMYCCTLYIISLCIAVHCTLYIISLCIAVHCTLYIISLCIAVHCTSYHYVFLYSFLTISKIEQRRKIAIFLQFPLGNVFFSHKFKIFLLHQMLYIFGKHSAIIYQICKINNSTSRCKEDICTSHFTTLPRMG